MPKGLVGSHPIIVNIILFADMSNFLKVVTIYDTVVMVYWSA